MPPITPTEPWPLPELQRARRAIVVVDVVESVRLMQEDESGFIDRWRRFVNEVRTEVLPAHGGRLVKSLGDGMLLEFASVPPAVAAAVALRARNAAVPTDRAQACVRIRVGIHVADIVADDLDIYGRGVNLAARLAALAGPEQIVISAEVRDALAPGFDPDLEDMGECFVKHLDEPVRAWRVVDSPGQAVDARPSEPSIDRQLRCAIAVLPFVRRASTSISPPLEFDAGGAVLADDVIEALMKGRCWRVVSRLSAATAAARGMTARELGHHLRVQWVVDGTLWESLGHVEARVTLVDAVADRVVAVERFNARRADFEQGDASLGRTIAEWAGRQVIDEETALVAARPLPAVQSHALLLSATQWMHRMARPEGTRADAALEHLIDRHPRSAEPRVWMAKAHLITLAQGWSNDPTRLAARARDLLARALDLQPEHALALALEGHLGAYAHGELDAAEHLFCRSMQINPNEPLTWLFQSNLLANRGEGAAAIAAADRAHLCSPLDPMAFMFDIYAAYAALIGGDAASAVSLARRSVRANRQHYPSHPVLICAEVAAGDIDAARASAKAYLALRPQSSVSTFAAAHRATPGIVAMLRASLREAGMPD